MFILIVLTAVRETILNAFHEFCWSLFSGQVRARNTSPDNKSRAKMGAFAIGAPFTFWVMDYMGPLPESSRQLHTIRNAMSKQHIRSPDRYCYHTSGLSICSYVQSEIFINVLGKRTSKEDGVTPTQDTLHESSFTIFGYVHLTLNDMKITLPYCNNKREL